MTYKRRGEEKDPSLGCEPLQALGLQVFEASGFGLAILPLPWRRKCPKNTTQIQHKFNTNTTHEPLQALGRQVLEASGFGLPSVQHCHCRDAGNARKQIRQYKNTKIHKYNSCEPLHAPGRQVFETSGFGLPRTTLPSLPLPWRRKCPSNMTQMQHK